MTADPDDYDPDITEEIAGRWDYFEENGRVYPDAETTGPIGDPSKGSPVMCLGSRDGVFYFLDRRGELRVLTARQLGSRTEQQALLLGDESWQRRHFPRFGPRRVKGELKLVIVGHSTAATAAWLIGQCATHPIFGSRMMLRRPGVWAGADGKPVIHCGDEVFIDGAWQPAGFHIGQVVYIADEPTPRPGVPCTVKVGQTIERLLGTLWRYRLNGASMMAMGVVGAGMLGALARWRPSLFLAGPAGSGKTKALNALRAMVPLHNFTTDTTPAGLQQSVTGRAMMSFIDEVPDNVEHRGGETLLNLTLSSTGEEGAKIARGTAEGFARSLSILGSYVFASTTPPDMQPQHLARVALVQLVAPDIGADHLARMDDLATYCAEHSADLWARALDSHERYVAALALFRDALGRDGCPPRQMDQLGAILAGWWILTHDGLPEGGAASGAVRSIADFVSHADEVANQSAARQVAEHFISSRVRGDRSSSEEWPIAELLQRAWETVRDPDSGEPMANTDATPRERLGRNGIRAVRGDQIQDNRDRMVPRGTMSDGVWIAYRAAPVVRLFEHTSWPGQRWRHVLAALPSVTEASKQVRIGNMPTRAAIWISRADLFGDESDAG